MGTFTITSLAHVNQPPSQVGNINLTINYEDEYEFTVDNFTIDTFPQYKDPEGDPPLLLKVMSLPEIGILEIDGIEVTLGQEIPFVQIAQGLLFFIPFEQTGEEITTGYTDSFTFKIADLGSEQFSSDTGTFTFLVDEKRNLPPSQVGDGEATIEAGQTLVFTTAMLSSALDPPYEDPEGDPPALLQITVLPVNGEIRLNGIAVIENQIISYEDIENGNLTYVPSQFAMESESFTFRIADEGSHQFTE